MTVRHAPAVVRAALPLEKANHVRPGLGRDGIDRERRLAQDTTTVPLGLKRRAGRRASLSGPAIAD